MKFVSMCILMALSPSLVLAAPSLEEAKKSLSGIQRSELRSYFGRTSLQIAKYNLGLLVYADIYTPDVQSLFDQLEKTASIEGADKQIDRINNAIGSLIDAKLKVARTDKSFVELTLSTTNQMVKSRENEISNLEKQIQSDKDFDPQAKAEFSAQLAELSRKQKIANDEQKRLAERLEIASQKGNPRINLLNTQVNQLKEQIAQAEMFLSSADSEARLNGLRQKLSDIERRLKPLTEQRDAEVREAARALEDFNRHLNLENAKILAQQTQINERIAYIISCQANPNIRAEEYGAQITSLQQQNVQTKRLASEAIQDLTKLNAQIALLEKKY